MRAIRSSPPASDELAEAIFWYEEQRQGLGADFFQAINQTIANIRSNPEIGSPLSDDTRTRRMLVPRFPFQFV